MRFGFCGPAYASQSPLVDAEALINWYPEQVESPNARTAYALYPTPGLSLFANLGNFPSVRGGLPVSGRRFFVAGTHLLEVSAFGGVTDYGSNTVANNNILDDGLPAILVAGGAANNAYPAQMLILSGGQLTAFSLQSNMFVSISGAPSQVISIDFLDGFFVAMTANNSFQVSNPEDCTNWSGLAISQVSVFSAQLLSLIASNRLLWVFGATRGVVYYNSGAPIFPFDVVSGGFLEVGISAQNSVARVATARGTTIMWLGGDERGAKIVYAAQGFTPTRVSDHALEFWMSNKDASGNIRTTTDAVGYSMQDQGHNFYVLWFPTADATWVLDADLGFWHQRSSVVAGVQHAHLARCHIYDGTQHLVGDRTSGKVYELDISNFNDNGTAIIRERIGPTVTEEGGRIPIPINEFQVDFETGVAPNPPLLDGNGVPRDPFAMFSYSEDFGKTWTPERMIPCGQAGGFKAAAVDRRLGSWYNWTPRVTVSDPIAWRIADAYVNGTQDHVPRLSKSFAKLT